MRLEELCAQVTDGKHGDCQDQPGSGFFFLSCKDVSNGKLNYEGAREITEADYLDTHRRTKLEPLDIVITNSGTIGRMAVVPRNDLTRRTTFQKSVAVLKPIPSKVEPRFLYYLLQAELERLVAFAGGTAQKNLLLRDLRAFAVEVPSRAVQNGVVSILSAYDDLIENNTRRIRILEEMAQMLYREWFVNFRFPGHEKVKMVESEMGPIPKGWQVTKATEAVDFDPTTKVPKEGLKPFVPMGSLSGQSMLITDIEEREGNSGSRFKNADTLFARITPCLENGKTGFVQFLPNADAVAFGSTEFIVLRSRTVCPEYVYLMARSEEFRDNAIKSMSGATGRQRVQQGCFEKFRLAQPPQDVLERFQGLAHPISRLIHNLNLRNTNLRTTRDLLLPKLISGEVSVENLELAATA